MDEFPASPLSPDNAIIDKLPGNTNPSLQNPSTTISGRATWFGLNPPDAYGRITEDTQDKPNSGFFINPRTGSNYNSHDPSEQFVSIPFSVARAFLPGNVYDPKIQNLVSNGAYKARVTANGRTQDFPIGDLGPAAWTGNALDFSGGAAIAMGLKDNTRASYQIIGPDGKPIRMNSEIGIDPNAPIESGRSRSSYANESLQRYKSIFPAGINALTPEEVNKIDYAKSQGLDFYSLSPETKLGYALAKDPTFLFQKQNLPLYKSLILDKAPGFAQQLSNVANSIVPTAQSIAQDAYSYASQVGRGDWANLAATNARGMGQGFSDALNAGDALWTGFNSWLRNAKSFGNNDPNEVNRLEWDNASASQDMAMREYQRKTLAQNVQNVASTAYAAIGMQDYARQVQSATPPKSAVDAASTISNPINFIPFGAGAKAAGAVKGMFFERAVDAAAEASRADTFATALKVSGISDQIVNQVAGTAINDSARIWQAIDKMSTEGGSVSGNLLQAVSGGISKTGDLAKAIVSKPDQLADYLSQGNTAAKLAIQGAMFKGIEHFMPPVAYILAGAKAISKVSEPIANLVGLAGKELSLGESSIPYFRRIAQQTDGLTRYIAGALDNPLVYTMGSMTKGAASGALIGGTLGEISAGGPNLQAALGGAGAGALYGMAGGGLGQWMKYGSPGQFMLEAAGDLRRFKSVLTTDQMSGFNRLAPDQQGMLAQYAQHFPGLQTNFIHDPAQPSGWNETTPEGRPSVTINTATATPLDGVIAHELAHATVSNGNYSDIIDSILGNPDKNIPAKYSNQEFEAMKKTYLDKLLGNNRAISHLTDKDIALEIYAEHGVDYLKSGQGLVDARSAFNPAVSANPNALKQAMSKLGYTFDAAGNNVRGNNLFERLGASKDVYNLQKAYFAEKRKYDLDYKEDRVDQIYRPEDQNASPGILDRFKAVPEIARDAKGNVMRGSDGQILYNSVSQVNKAYRMLGEDIKKQLSFLPQADKETIGHVTEGDGTVHFNYLPDSIIKNLKDSNRYNSEQLKNLEILNEARKDPAKWGNEYRFFYQAALRKGKYGSIAGADRYWTPYGFSITNKNNMLIKGVDFSKLSNKYLELQNRSWMKDARFTGLPDFVSAVQKYFENHVQGLPGATDLGIAKRDAINATLGLDTNSWRDSNPLAKLLPSKSGSFILTPRLDRINNLYHTDTIRPFRTENQYNLINRNFLPSATPSRTAPGTQATAAGNP